MRSVLSALARAVGYCMLPQAIWISVLPLLVATGSAAVLAHFFWQPAQEVLVAFLDASVIVSTMGAWLAAVGLPGLKTMLAPLILIVVLTPVVAVSSVLLVSTTMTPALVNLVARRRFPQLQRRQGASFFASVVWACLSCLLALLATVISSPMWIVPPLVLILPPAIWAWLTYRIMAFDALASHASAAERQTLMQTHRLALMGMALVVGFLGAAPSLLWSAGLMALAMAPLLLPVSVWLYSLVFVFASLWFIHYCLDALHTQRQAQEAEVFSPVVPEPPVQVMLL